MAVGCAVSTLGYVALAIGGGAALAAVIYALYTNHSLSSTIAAQASLIIGLGSKLSDSDRNALSYQQQRDTEKARADRAESELADVKAQLESTQAALNKADQESTDAASEAVRTADDPLATLNAQLRSEADASVSSGADAGTSDGHQG